MAQLNGKQLWKVALPGALILALAVIHTSQRREAFTALLGEERPQDGWRWIKPEGTLHTPTYYDHPLNNFGNVNPYTDLPRANVRGLPDMDHSYDMSYDAPPVQTPGMKTVFSTRRAMSDLNAMKEFGLVDDKAYEKKRYQIQSSSIDPFTDREGVPTPDTPEGWTGATKMCRDVTTNVGKSLDNKGWADLNTLKCCSYLCSHTQWKALRVGELKGSFGSGGRYSRAVHTGTAGMLADGTSRYLCRTCAWYKEPTWDQLANSTDTLDNVE